MTHRDDGVAAAPEREGAVRVPDRALDRAPGRGPDRAPGGVIDSQAMRSRLGPLPLWAWVLMVLVVAGAPKEYILAYVGIEPPTPAEVVGAVTAEEVREILGDAGYVTADQVRTIVAAAVPEHTRLLTELETEGEGIRRDVARIQRDVEAIREIVNEMSAEMRAFKASRHTAADQREYAEQVSKQITDLWRAIAGGDAPE